MSLAEFGRLQGEPTLSRRHQEQHTGVSCVRPGLCRSRGCNRRDDHSWARMGLASRHRTRHKWPCAFRVGRARQNVHPRRMRCGVPRGKMDNDQADSPDLFAGKTLVHLRWIRNRFRTHGTWGFCLRSSTRDLLVICWYSFRVRSISLQEMSPVVYSPYQRGAWTENLDEPSYVEPNSFCCALRV